MAYLMFALMFLGGVSAATYLVITDHPWFALGVLLITASLRITQPSTHVEAEFTVPKKDLPELSKILRDEDWPKVERPEVKQ